MLQNSGVISAAMLTAMTRCLKVLAIIGLTSHKLAECIVTACNL